MMTPSHFKHFYIIIPLLTAALLVPASCGKRQAPERGKTAGRAMTSAPIEGYIVKASRLDYSITVSGTIKSFEETVLMPEVTGRVVAMHLPEGSSVKQGALLVKLFDDDLQAQLKKAKAQLDIAKQTLERLAELIKVSGVSRSEYDQAALQVNALTADIEILSAQIRKTEVRAPYDGVLGLRTISIGAQVTPQTPLTTLRSVNKLKLDFSIPEKYASVVTPGMKLTFAAEGSDAIHTAAILATEQGIDAATRNLRVRAIVNDAGASLTPGAFARITLDLGGSDSALMIPTQAIIPRERDKQVIVAAGGKASMVTVTTGIRRESTIEITAGLSAGDTVVTTGLLFLRPGMPVNFSRIAQ